MAEAQTTEPRPGVTVVTGENFDSYVDSQLGTKTVSVAEIQNDAAKGESDADSAAEKGEPEKAAVEPAAETGQESEGETGKKGKIGLNKRFSELTAEAKTAKEAAAKAASEAKAAREARDAAEATAAALRAKYEPPKSGEIGPEPQPAQFTDITEYSKALKDWTQDKTERDISAKATQAKADEERAATAKAWGERQTAAKAEIPDYETTLASSDAKVSDIVRDAIVESEVGPKILYHLAKNPDVAARIAGMTGARALVEIGRIESSLGGVATKEVKETKATPVGEISKAPPPISPLKGAGSPVVSLRGSDEVPQGMTHEEWKKLYLAGKIQ